MRSRPAASPSITSPATRPAKAASSSGRIRALTASSSAPLAISRPDMPLDPETFEALLATVRRFVAERLRPLEERVDREDEVPAGIVAEMRAMGLFGLSI